MRLSKHDRHLMLITLGMVATTFAALTTQVVSSTHLNIMSLFINLIWLWDAEL